MNSDSCYISNYFQDLYFRIHEVYILRPDINIIWKRGSAIIEESVKEAKTLWAQVQLLHIVEYKLFYLCLSIWVSLARLWEFCLIGSAGRFAQPGYSLSIPRYSLSRMRSFSALFSSRYFLSLSRCWRKKRQLNGSGVMLLTSEWES